MNLETPHCPQCGELAKGTVEQMKGCANLLRHHDGSFEYSGSTEIWWDEQRTVTDKKDRVLLICDNGHDWYSVVSYPPKTVDSKVA